MTAYDIMRAWDTETGIIPRDDSTLDQDVGPEVNCLRDADPWDGYPGWLQALEAGDVAAILLGRERWGLPPLG